ncbi:diguanylate phosphodiesterase [Sulfurimicrobium lacus]|uniref:Diguanylate phosphodiesterase n=1 Tax=Sulfurimicrobium lacus TaxID=2715678 RepID=A0A6F8VER7_9PROT|nr:GGDEF domain-containing protein [Sulfurimicrobium lacus]BCB28313.1 diguanylate phosphodiesterase [Sulfurimicrobium lacus]
MDLAEPRLLQIGPRNGHEQPPASESENLQRLDEILAKRQLTPFFQPILNLASGQIFGYEGLIRGPSDSPLHSPANLFKAAEMGNRLADLERLCRLVTLENFVKQQLPGRLFLNVSPECLLQSDFRQGETLRLIHQLDLNPSRVVIELTENKPIYDYNLLREAVHHYRSMGFEIAMDDLGAGFSSLRLWSELRPEFVKIDMHFVQGINQDPVKLQFVRSIQVIAESLGTHVIAEGIETQAELNVVHDLGIAFGQGYHIARPRAIPPLSAPAEVVDSLKHNHIAVYPQNNPLHKAVTARKLLRTVPTVTDTTTAEAVYQIFTRDPELHVLPVVKDGRPLGLISRFSLLDRFAQPYQRELYGRKSCTRFMDNHPLMVEQSLSLQELSRMVAEGERRHLADGFIITEAGQFLGVGSSQDLIREITELQLQSARYANPLTMLPGNVPINEHIERLLQSGSAFVVCYCDLDNFKPFNDRYGYRKGDDMIQLVAGILRETSDPERDFVGHIGGDDFVTIFQSDDWEWRCQQALRRFDAAVQDLFDSADKTSGGFHAQSRQGEALFFPLTSLSIGAVPVIRGAYRSHHDIAAAAAEAKKQAKLGAGNTLFIERRNVS